MATISGKKRKLGVFSSSSSSSSSTLILGGLVNVRHLDDLDFLLQILSGILGRVATAFLRWLLIRNDCNVRSLGSADVLYGVDLLADNVLMVSRRISHILTVWFTATKNFACWSWAYSIYPLDRHVPASNWKVRWTLQHFGSFDRINR